MDPMRSSSAPSASRLQSHTTAKRRPPHHITRRSTPSPAAAQQRTNFGRHPVIPPLGQPWPKPPQNQATPTTRPVAAPQHGQRRQSQVTTMHQRPNHPLQSHFPLHTPMPGYNYLPVMYPPAVPSAPPMIMHPQFMPFTAQTTMPQYIPAAMPYPYPSLTQYIPAAMPYPPLTHAQYMPAAYPHSYTSLFPQPIVPEITELNPRERFVIYFESQ